MTAAGHVGFSADDVDAVLALVRATQTGDRATFVGVLGNIDRDATIFAAVAVINRLGASLAVDLGAGFDIDTVLAGARRGVLTDNQLEGTS